MIKLTYTTKKQIAKIQLPRDVKLELKGRHLHISTIIDEFCNYISIGNIQLVLERELANYFVSSFPGRITFNSDLFIEHKINPYYTTWYFYKTVEETIEITSQKQMIAIAKDLFTNT